MTLPINLANVQAAVGFDYPPGRYLFQVESVEIKANNDGVGQRLVVNNAIVMGPGPSTQFQGRKLANSYQLSEKGAPFLKRLFHSCGIDEAFIQSQGGVMEESWLIGRQYVASVIKNGTYTNISNEKPVSEWNNGADGAPKTAAATAPAVAPAATAAPAMLQPAPGAIPAPVGHVAPPPPQGGIVVGGLPTPAPPPAKL